MNKLDETDYYGCMEDANSMMVAEDSPVYNYIQDGQSHFQIIKRSGCVFILVKGCPLRRLLNKKV